MTNIKLLSLKINSKEHGELSFPLVVKIFDKSQTNKAVYLCCDATNKRRVIDELSKSNVKHTSVLKQMSYTSSRILKIVYDAEMSRVWTLSLFTKYWERGENDYSSNFETSQSSIQLGQPTMLAIDDLEPFSDGKYFQWSKRETTTIENSVFNLDDINDEE